MKKAFSIRIDTELLERIRKQANKEGRKRNNMIEVSLLKLFPKRAVIEKT